jgi:hypothetical protein
VNSNRRLKERRFLAMWLLDHGMNPPGSEKKFEHLPDLSADLNLSTRRSLMICGSTCGPIDPAIRIIFHEMPADPAVIPQPHPAAIPGPGSPQEGCG